MGICTTFKFRIHCLFILWQFWGYAIEAMKSTEREKSSTGKRIRQRIKYDDIHLWLIQLDSFNGGSFSLFFFLLSGNKKSYNFWLIVEAKSFAVFFFQCFSSKNTLLLFTSISCSLVVHCGTVRYKFSTQLSGCNLNQAASVARQMHKKFKRMKPLSTLAMNAITMIM